MGEKKNALVQLIIEIACKNDFGRQAKAKAISKLIEDYIEEPLIYAASVWLSESFLEKENDHEKYLKGYHNDIPSAVEDLRNEMRTAMND